MKLIYIMWFMSTNLMKNNYLQHCFSEVKLAFLLHCISFVWQIEWDWVHGVLWYWEPWWLLHSGGGSHPCTGPEGVLCCVWLGRKRPQVSTGQRSRIMKFDSLNTMKNCNLELFGLNFTMSVCFILKHGILPLFWGFFFQKENGGRDSADSHPLYWEGPGHEEEVQGPPGRGVGQEKAG